MKELIKEAEKLYKNIDETQSHLIKARLDKDRIREHLELIGLETIVFDAKQLLKCIIDRKDNIVDLGEIWHDITEEPKLGAWLVGQIGETAYDTFISAIEGKRMSELFDGYNIKRWAYLDDLLPKGGE